MPQRLNTKDPDFETAFTAFLVAKREVDSDVDQVVGAILAEVRDKGDEAVIAYTRRFDKLSLTPETMRVKRDEIDQAVAACPAEVLQALELMAERVIDFHSRQRPDDLDYVDKAGLRLGYRWTPIAAVGLYVPGGTAAYPSSVLMNALPARVAGVDRLAMVVPAPSGNLSPLVLAAARIAEVDEIYRLGGAQAIGALAYGTATIAPVDKIVGPGNAYVAAAKRRVFGTVGIDMIAGPSEVLVVADGANDPRWIAADLLAQAEHDPSAQAILITDDKEFANAVVEAVDQHLDTLSRAEIARESWRRFGAVLTVSDQDEAVELIDRLAPEHLELAVDDPEALAAKVRNAGAIFLGRYTPEALGDYVAGPNHILPTSRSARFSSGLGVQDFIKRSTFIGCDAEVLAKLGPAARTLAEAEGLSAHALSLSIRLEQRGKD